MASFRFLRYLIVYPLIFLLVVPSWNISEQTFRRILRVLFFSAAIVFVLAFLDGLTSFGNTYVTTGLTEGLTFTRTRAISTLGNPNNLGSYAGLVIITLAVLQAEGVLRKVAPRWLGLVLFLGAVGSLYLSFSRGAPIAIVFVAPWLLYLYHKRQQGGRGLLLVALALALFITLLFIIADVRGPTSSIARRIGQVPFNFELMGEKPWSYVVGLGIARGFTGGESRLAIDALDFTRSDNFFLLVFVEGGLIGLGLFVYLLARIFGTLKTSYDTADSPMLRASSSLAVGMLFYVCGWGMTAVSFKLFPAGFLIWMFIAIALSMIRRGQEKLSESGYVESAKRPLALRGVSATPGT